MLQGYLLSFLLAATIPSYGVVATVPETNGCDLNIPVWNGQYLPPEGGVLGITHAHLSNFKLCTEQARASCMGWAPTAGALAAVAAAQGAVGGSAGGARGSHQSGQTLGTAKGSKAADDLTNCYALSIHCMQGAGRIRMWVNPAQVNTIPTKAEVTAAMTATEAYCETFKTAGQAYAGTAVQAAGEVDIANQGLQATDSAGAGATGVGATAGDAATGGSGIIEWARDNPLMAVGIAGGAIGAGAIIENNTDGKSGSSLPAGCGPKDVTNSQCATFFSGQCYQKHSSNKQCAEFSVAYCGGTAPGKSSMYCSMSALQQKCQGASSSNSMSCNWYRNLPSNCKGDLSQIPTPACRPNLTASQYEQGCLLDRTDALCNSPFNLIVSSSGSAARQIAAVPTTNSVIGAQATRVRDILPMQTNLFQRQGSGITSVPLAP